ncbi:hypothetical protein Tsubulata_945358 [Turnera subulata]|uniref:BED-type domain-containing protein n=1 Tax=Turnera subulata TaxID=218843 RepID=A0A9Q0G086_9ROSI|nr:hypothetical protein Tsubulata_945358 [Turnera subulata]
MSSGQENKRKKRDGCWQYVIETAPGISICKFCGHKFGKGTSVSRIKLHLSGAKSLGVKICQKVPENIRRAGIGSVKKRCEATSIPTNGRVAEMMITNSRGEANNEAPVDQGEIFLHEEDGNIVGLNVEARIGTSRTGIKLLTAKVVGTAFQMNKDMICSWLLEDDVSCVGIHGMAGVGKTELAKHINNALLEKPNISVCWVTVSPDFSIRRIQNAIAKVVDLDLSSEDDENIRVAMLSGALSESKSSVVILDDIWDTFALERVGLPIGVKECKVILTTQSLESCRMMGCRKIARVEPLNYEESWTLFETTLRNETRTTFSEEVLEMAKSVARECEGLPLGIISMAARMRGKPDECLWRDVLRQVTGAVPFQENTELFRSLKRSYEHLNDAILQRCFLHCALYWKIYDIDKAQIAEFLVDEGIIFITGMDSRQAEIDRCQTMLSRLESICLVSFQNFYITMHPLVRKWAIQTLQKEFPVMMEAGKGLTELPEEGKWTEDLVKVSLMSNDIKEISSNHSPMCPNISTLTLRRNFGLRYIAGSFFEKMRGLKVLDLSETGIEELPSSISNLAGLNALILRWCKKLRRVPSLANLKALQKLDLYRTGIQELPGGMECLCNLRYLDLSFTELEVFPSQILPKLFCLQFLSILNTSYQKETSTTVRAQEVALLRKLETLAYNFSDPTDFNHYLKSRQCCPTQFVLSIGQPFWDPFCTGSREVWFKECNNMGERGAYLRLPRDTKRLEISNCHDVQSLCDASPSLNGATELKSVWIEECDGIQCLIRLSCLSSYPEALKSLESLSLWHLKSLEVLFSRGDVAPAPGSPTYSCFSHLKTIMVWDCPRLKVLFPLGLPVNLPNLEEIKVLGCKELEELVESREGGEEQQQGTRNLQNNYFSHLKTVEVEDCPRLKVLFPLGLPVNLSNLEEITVLGCKELEELVESSEGGEEQQQGTRNLQNNYFSHLKTVEVKDCPRLKVLFPLGLPVNLSNLEEITVSRCKELEELVESSERGEEQQQETRNLQNNYFSHLKTVEVEDCPRLKVLFPLGLPVNLSNLEEITVSRWEQQQETRNLPQFSLPRLETLYLTYLPELKWIYGGSITCTSIRYIEVLECPKLRRMPISLPLLDNGLQPSPPPSLLKIKISPKEWWDSVEWDHPQSKEVLGPLCEFEDDECYSSSRGIYIYIQY